MINLHCLAMNVDRLKMSGWPLRCTTGPASETLTSSLWLFLSWCCWVPEIRISDKLGIDFGFLAISYCTVRSSATPAGSRSTISSAKRCWRAILLSGNLPKTTNGLLTSGLSIRQLHIAQLNILIILSWNRNNACVIKFKMMRILFHKQNIVTL